MFIDTALVQLFKDLLKHGVSHEAYVRLGSFALQQKERERLLDLLLSCEGSPDETYVLQEYRQG